MTESTWRSWVHAHLFEHAPCNIAIIDRDYTIVDNNRNFMDVFGDGRGRKCYEIYKGRTERCDQCVSERTFSDGRTRVNDEVGRDRKGRTTHYIVHTAPVVSEDGSIPYLIGMSTDITETKRLQSEYKVLFETVPCYIAVLNRELRIVRANEASRETFGDTTGEHCWEVYKRRAEKCPECPAEKTFSDGLVHTGTQTSFTKDGRQVHVQIITSPMSGKDDPNVSHVFKIALDVSHTQPGVAGTKQVPATPGAVSD